MPRNDRDFEEHRARRSEGNGGGGRSARAAVPAEQAQATGPTTKGHVKRITRDKGFGFIRDEGGAEYFFHRSEANGEFDTMQEGDAVTFTPMASAKGPRAHQVVLA